MSPADQYAVVDALTKAAIELGWVPISTDTTDARMITVVLRPRVVPKV